MYIIGSDEWHQKAEDWEEFKYPKNTSETSTFRAKALRWKVNDEGHLAFVLVRSLIHSFPVGIYSPL